MGRKSDTVFVVDDDFRVREALTDLFASRNLDCIAFASAAEYLGSANPIGVICHGPWSLVEADVVRGRTLTSWPSVQEFSASARSGVTTRR